MLSDGDIAGLRTRLDTIVNYYVKLLNELAELPIIDEWEELDDLIEKKEVSFTIEDAEKQDSIFRKIRKQHEYFIGTKVSESLAEECRKFWEAYWTALINNARVKNQLWEAGEGEKTISNFSPVGEGHPEDKYLLRRVRANGDEAAHYLVHAEIESDLDGELSMKLFPPFAKHSDGTYVDWQRMRNHFQHRDWKTNREKHRHVELFYGNPGYLRFRLEEYEDLVERCFRVLSDDIRKDQSHALREEARESHQLLARARYSSEMIKKQIQSLEWSPEKWVNPNEGRTTLVEDLHSALERSPIVQLHGTGGLGKTALSLKYIMENLDGNLDIEPYENVVILTSKDWPQGEYDTVHYNETLGLADDHPDNPSNPRNPRVNPGQYYSGRFELFIERLAGLNPDSTKRSRDRAIDLINQKNVLVVLDNFEDVMESDIQQENENELNKYLDFFNEFTRPEGRIIVTTRETLQDPNVRKLQLLPLSKYARTELMRERFIFLSQDYGIPAHKIALEFFLPTVLSGRAEVFEEVAEALGSEFEENIGYPHVLFMFTKELMEAAENFGDIKEAITWVATHADEEGLRFVDYVEEQWEWSIKKSYSKVRNNPTCLSILKELWQLERGTTTREIVDRTGLTRRDVEDAINLLTIHGVFLDKSTRVRESGPATFGQSGSDSFRLKVGARRRLSLYPEFKDLNLNENLEPTTEAQEADLKMLKNLGRAIEAGEEAVIEVLLGGNPKSKLHNLVNNPPGGVLISNRKPVNENIVRFALKLSDQLRFKYNQEAEIHPISTLNLDFEEVLLQACLKLAGQEKADCSFFIGEALGILDRRD